MKPVVIIAPEAAAQGLRRAIETEGFRNEFFPDFPSAFEAIVQRKYSLALLAFDAADGDAGGMARQVSRFIPAIVLPQACGGGAACVTALECGADDCVPRSVSPRELIARMKNVLRRSGTSAEESAEWVAKILSEMRAHIDGRTVELTRGEVEVLTVLVEESPRPLTALEIADRLGARRGTVEARIKSLRDKLGRERLISRGRLGYVFAAEAEER